MIREFCWRCFQWYVRDEGCRLMFHGKPCGVEIGGVGARRSRREVTCRADFPAFPQAGSEGELWGILCQLRVAKGPV